MPTPELAAAAARGSCGGTGKGGEATTAAMWTSLSVSGGGESALCAMTGASVGGGEDGECGDFWLSIGPLEAAASQPKRCLKAQLRHLVVGV